jgi:hypothetical protein
MVGISTFQSESGLNLQIFFFIFFLVGKSMLDTPLPCRPLIVFVILPCQAGALQTDTSKIVAVKDVKYMKLYDFCPALPDAVSVSQQSGLTSPC